MAKRKKTREQKIAATAKRQEAHLSYSLDIPALTKVSLEKPHHTTYASYTYVIADLKKTLYVTAAIVVAEVILFFLLQHRVINLPGVVY